MNKLLGICFKSVLTFVLIVLFGISCKNEEIKNVISLPENSVELEASTSELILSEENDSLQVIKFSWNKPNYGVNVPLTLTLEFTLIPEDVDWTTAWELSRRINVDSKDLERSFIGVEFNKLLVSNLMVPGDSSVNLAVRLVVDLASNVINPDNRRYSDTLQIEVTPYSSEIELPALQVIGGNSWVTPSVRTDGFILTSPNQDDFYEGYLNLPDADGFGGDAFVLVSTETGTAYGWGTDEHDMSVDGGNLWLTPAPNYMKVNVNLAALTIDFTPVKFFIAGDDNDWSTSDNPMTFNAETNQWVAENVSLTKGNSFVFIANEDYDISYKVDEDGDLVFAGAPDWPSFDNIPVPETGVYTVILDLSRGDGNYTYSIK